MSKQYAKQLAEQVAPTKEVIHEVVSGLEWHGNPLQVDTDGPAVITAKLNDFVEILFFFHPSNVKKGKAEINLKATIHNYRGEEYTGTFQGEEYTSGARVNRTATYTIEGANVATLTKRVQTWIDSQSAEIAEHTARVITWQKHIDDKIEQNEKMIRLIGATAPATPHRQRDCYPRRDWDVIVGQCKVDRNLIRDTYTLQVEDLTDDEVRAMVQALTTMRSK